MFTILFGILMFGFTAFAALPPEMHGLGWGNEIIHFLKGFAPVLAAFIGIVAVFVGFADMKDRREARKAESEAEK